MAEIELQTIIAASHRGWSAKMIAVAAGVSRQAIEQRLARAGETIICPKHRMPETAGRILFKCEQCKTVFWIKPSAHHHNERFCSMRCYGRHERKIPEEKIKEAIELRRNGNTWTHIKKLMGCPAQTIQIRIWRYLHESGLLTRAVVYGIWYPSVAQYRERKLRVGWAWIENNTGLLLRD